MTLILKFLTALLLVPLSALHAAELTTEKDIQRAINDAIHAGGGEVRIPAGTWVIAVGARSNGGKFLNNTFDLSNIRA